MNKCLSTAILALSFALISCSGGKDNPAPPPPPQVSIGITPNTATAKPTKSVELAVTARNTDIIFPTDVQGSFTVTNNQVTYTPPSIAGTYEFTVTASADTTKKATARITVDDSRTKGYLIQSLAEVCKDIVNKEIPESEWSAKGQLIKDAFVHGWQYDSYSVNIPFTTDEIRNGVQKIEFEFHYPGTSMAGIDVILGTKVYDPGSPESHLAQTIVHELGHCMGLSEQLTELLKYKFAGLDLGLSGNYGNSDNFYYNPFFCNMLLEKVGDSQFWNLVWRSSNPNQAFSKMWDDNMTVSRDGYIRTLVNHAAFMRLHEIDRDARGAQELNLMETFIPFSGIVNVREEIAKLPRLFHEALINGNIESQNKLENFFNIVERYFEAYPLPYVWTVAIVELWRTNFLQNTLESASQSLPNAA
jgi:hypothetical protein